METEKAIYFYGDKDKYGFMCYEDKIFNCSEQYFMYRKALMFDSNNKELLTKILEETNPKKIKSFGRKVKNFDQTTWEHMRFEIMCEALILKFNQNSEIKLQLLDTGDKKLYEASPYDKTWGTGFSPKESLTTDHSKFGRNLLGESLMIVRLE